MEYLVLCVLGIDRV